MTQEQKEIFISYAQAGIACGLNHPVEWYVNGSRMINHMEYDKIGERLKELDDAFVAFYAGTASCPEEQEEIDKIGPSDYFSARD